MHSNTRRLRAASLVAAAVLVIAACGDRAESASSRGDNQAGTDARIGRAGLADVDPDRGRTSGSGVPVPATDDWTDGGDSGPIEAEPRITEGRPVLGTPDELVPEMRQQLDDADANSPGHDGDVLEIVEPLDRAPAPEEPVDLRDGHRRNEAGELNHLDEPAALACSDVERALTALDDGDRQAATGLLVSAANRADRSTVDDIVAWSTTLAEPVDPGSENNRSLAPLLGFLSACTRGGYEL